MPDLPGRRDRRPADFRRGESRQSAPQLSDGGASPGNDNRT